MMSAKPWSREAWTRLWTENSKSSWWTAKKWKSPPCGHFTRRISKTTTSTPWLRLLSAERDDRATSRGHSDDETSRDPPGRRHQPLVSCDGNEPRLILAANAYRQHRPTRRRQPHLGRQLQSRAVPGLGMGRTGLQRLGGGRSFSAQSQRERARQRDPRPRVHQGRGTSLLEPRRPGIGGE